MPFILFSMVFVLYMFVYWMKAGEDMLWFPFVPREKSKKEVVVLTIAHAYMYSFICVLNL